MIALDRPVVAIPVAEVLTHQETIFPARETTLPAILAYSNEADFDPARAAALRNNTYAERKVVSPPFRIGRLPSYAIMRGTEFVLCVGDDVVAEYIGHHPREVARDAGPRLAAMLREANQIEDIEAECFLLKRRGAATWGHWMGEFLPIAASVEMAHPGRFRYLLTKSGNERYDDVVAQSLGAYGIVRERLIWTLQQRDYRLLNTWAATPIWAGNSPHPGALDAVRRIRDSARDGAGPKRFAPTRNGARGISNKAEVRDVLFDAGFYMPDPSANPFTTQVWMFADADVVFSVLGSGLAGLIYAPDNVRVIAAGPAGWLDGFFCTLAQHRNARWADVKGLSTDPSNVMWAPFDVPIPALREALETIESTGNQGD